MERFTLGKIVVSRIEEWQGEFTPPSALFSGFEERGWGPREGEFVPEYYRRDTGNLYAFLQSWLLDTGDRRILFDTGAGNDKDRPGIPVFGGLQTDFLERLARAGFEPGDIDVVVCSHIHVDHVGWNTRLVDGKWEATFRNARYVLPQADRDYWNPLVDTAGPGEIGVAVNAGMFEDSVAPLMAENRVEWASDGMELAPGITLQARSGHTPGSMVMDVCAGEERALFCGDVVHHPIQIYEPEWNSIFCEDPERARQSRRDVLNQAADTGALLVPAHFGGDHCVRVARDGKAFRPIYPRAR